MKTLRTSFIALALSVASIGAFAQDVLVVSTGDAKAGSTYSKVFNELNRVCSAKNAPMTELTSTGSIQNIDNLTSNKVDAAVVQADLLFFTKATDPAKIANVKTLVSLYPEELHFIARADVKKEGGFMGLGGNKVSFNTLNDLSGRPVGAVGGSVLSGRVVSAQSGLNFQIVEFPNNDALKTALLEGKVDSILVVGGAPHALVTSLDQRFRLLPVSAELQKKLGSVYAPAKLSYSNLNQAGIDTITTQSLIVTRTYKSPAKLQQLAKIRECFVNEVPNIQDARGSHPKWQLVDVADKGKWDYYDLPKAK